MNMFRQNLMALQDNQLKNDIERVKAMEPYIERAQRNALVRQQAMNASMTNSYAMLGALSVQGKMMQQAQREMGANFRTGITANPYGDSIVASPQISF